MKTTLQARINRAHARIYEGLEHGSNASLQFSGGKDSLACLYLARPFWKSLTVTWINTGDEVPETRCQMDAVRAMVPSFLEVKGNAKSTQQTYGWPVDMLPTKDTLFGCQADPDVSHIRLVGVFDCCNANMWKPMEKAVAQHGFDLLIRGQRDNERLRNTGFEHGSVDPLTGIRCVLPIHDWTSQDVFEYLEHEGVKIPSQYAYGLTSLDCLHCTAYLHEKEMIIPFLRDRHPEAAIEVERRLHLISQAQQTERTYLAKALSAKRIVPGLRDGAETGKIDKAQAAAAV